MSIVLAAIKAKPFGRRRPALALTLASHLPDPDICQKIRLVVEAQNSSIRSSRGRVVTNRLPLAEANLRLAQHPDNLLRRKPLPCHSSSPIIGLEIAGFS